MEVQSRIVTYAMAIAQLVTDDTLTDKMRNRKFSAVQKAAASMDAYAQEGVRRRVDRRSTLRSGRRTGYLVPDFPQGPAYPRWAAKIPFSI